MLGKGVSFGHSGVGGSARRALAVVLAVLAVGLTLVPGPVAAQVSGIGVGVTPAFDRPPGGLPVGAQNRQAIIQFSNVSFGAGALEPVTVTNIRLNTSCDANGPVGLSPVCPVPEPRVDLTRPVLAVDTPSNPASTTCPGGPFTLTGPDANMDYTITPNFTLAPVGQPGSVCQIGFTFDVEQRPFDGETFGIARITITSPTFPDPQQQSGATLTTIAQVAPALTTLASPNIGVAPASQPASVPIGSTVTDQATVTGVPNAPAPTGTVTYRLVGPAPNATCTEPVVPPGGLATVPVGTASPSFTIPAAGTYNFVASYSGDVNYLPVANVGCGVAAEQVIANQRTATLQTLASPNTPASPNAVVAPGTTVFDIATVTPVPPVPPALPGPAPTGTVTYRLVGPNPDALCAGPIVPPTPPASESVPVGSPSPSYVVTLPGVYNFVASFTDPSGVFAPIPVTGCGDPFERFTVAAPLPQVMVVKTVAPPTMPEPGGNFTYTVVVSNPGPVPINITSLNDSVYGNLAALPAPPLGTACSTLLAPPPGFRLAPGASAPACQFVAPFTGQRGATLTDIVTVVGTDDLGQTATAIDDATVLLTGVPPAVEVVKTPSPDSLPEPGGNFTYTVRVTNTSTLEPLTINSLTDDVYGNLAVLPAAPGGAPACGTLINTTLAPGASSPACTFVGNFMGVGGDALTDTVTVVGTDDDGEQVTDSNDATVTLTRVLPQVRVVKTASPPTQPAPTGTFTFTATVSNPGTKPIIITSLVDSVYGDLSLRPAPAGTTSCASLIGMTVTPGQNPAPTCTFTGTFTGVAGQSENDTVTVTARDLQNNVVTDQDTATVSLFGAPSIVVIKKAQPSTLPEPGGTFTFTAQVVNTSPEPLTILTLTDVPYGDLAVRPAPAGTTACSTLIGTRLAPGASSPVCTFTGPFNGVAGQTQTDTVTVTGRNDAGAIVSDTDQATVGITNVVPVIDVDKTATPLVLPAPGGTFTFRVVVSNPSAEPLTITRLNDVPYGDLATIPGSTCGALIGTTLAPGASSAPCTFPGVFNGLAGAQQTDVVTVTGTDAQGTVVTATDDATVSIINIVPDIAIEKSATPASLPAPGGVFRFDVLVTNTGPNNLTITRLTDDKFGDITVRPAPAGGTSCATAFGTVLIPGGTFACSFTGNVNGPGGTVHTNVATVIGVDGNGVVVTDNNDATVNLTTVTPTVQVVKTASPSSLPEPGGAFTFTAVVTNTGTNPVTITSLIDDPYGNLALRPAPAGTTSCASLIGTTLAPGASSPTCTFNGNFIGDAGATQTDVVRVVVTDAQGQTATDTDEATVFITDVAPSITVVKTAAPLSMPAPGGTFMFTVLVTNTSFEPVRITSLIDNVYGDINGKGNCAIGATLAPSGGTYTCTFPGDFRGVPNQGQTDIVTVTAVDGDGTPVMASDDARVTLTGPPAELTTQVSAGAVGSSVFDTATLRGGFNPTGTITFQLYNNDTCTGPPLFTNVKPVSGTTDPRIVVSDSFILPAPGVYHFVARYSGDANNAPVGPTACLDPNETIGVGRLPVSLSTVASPTVGLGGAVFDTATIGGGFGATGTVTFTLYGPDDATCSRTPAFTSVKPVPTSGIVVSDSFTPTAPGVYRFVANYSGDANNAPATTPCSDPLEQVIVTPLPVIQVDKTAIPDSLPAPGGNVVFRVAVTNTSNVPLTIRSLVDNVYGDITARTASTCNTAIGTVLAPAPGPGNTYNCQFVGPVQGAAGSVHTDVVTVTATDARGNTVRDNDDAIVRITEVPPTITTTKVATPGSLPEPGGTFTFNFTVTNTGPNPVTITSLVDDVYGNLNARGTCAIGARLVSGATYSCSFTGNFQGNAGATQTDTITTTARDDAGQTVTSQSRATVRLTDVPPTITVTKSPDPVSRPEPGGSFRFTVTVTNTGPENVTITSLVDDIYGDLNGRGSCAIGVRLVARGGAYSCAFDGEFRGVAGASQTDTVTATAIDDDNTSVTAIAKATVTLTPVGTPPVIPPPVIPPPVIPPTPPVAPPLVRTGSDLAGPARLAGLLLLVGMTLIAATRRFGEGGPGLTPVPAGPGSGPRPGGGGAGGLGFGGASWFSGSPRRPQGPLAGLGTGLAESPTPAREPAAEAAPIDREPDWDGWVSRRAPVLEAPVVDEPAAALDDAAPEAAATEPFMPEPEAGAPEALMPALALSEVAVAELGAPEPEAAVPEVLTAEFVGSRVGFEVVVPEAVLPHDIMGSRTTSALDGAALDAAQALSGPARIQAPPSGRRRGGKPGRR